MSRTMLCPHCWGTKVEPPPGDGPCAYCAATGVREDEPVSLHFMLSELLHSDAAIRQGIPNDPSPAIVAALRELAADLLEPLRARFGAIHVNSGYRAPAVNAAIGGSVTSAHMLGSSADVVALTAGITRKAMAEWVIASGLLFDQVIHEGTWLHLGRRSPVGAVRREALMMFGGKYFPYDAADPRTAT